MNPRYDDIEFMTLEMVYEILSEFSWPAVYELEDGLPDYICVQFPECGLTFNLGFEGRIHLRMWSKNEINNWHSLDSALLVLKEEADDNVTEPVLRAYHSEVPSTEKAQHDIRNICILLQTYLLPTILGDFSWVERYNAIVKMYQR